MTECPSCGGKAAYFADHIMNGCDRIDCPECGIFVSDSNGVFSMWWKRNAHLDAMMVGNVYDGSEPFLLY